MTGTDGRAPAVVPRRGAEGKRDGEARRDWSWVEPTVWTARMLTTLEVGVKGGRHYQWPYAFFADHGLFSLQNAYDQARQSSCR